MGVWSQAFWFLRLLGGWVLGRLQGPHTRAGWVKGLVASTVTARVQKPGAEPGPAA
jgi:hypothetical protein